MDESRKQFEQKIQHSYGEDYLVVNDDGDYVNWITADLWEFWQASRESMKPSGVCALTVTNSTGEEISISDVIGFEVVEYKGA